jgi:hypothetical protein
MTGFTFSAAPTSRLALPIRPPRKTYSTEFMQTTKLIFLRNRSASARISSTLAPASRALAAASTCQPRPIVAWQESKTWMGMPVFALTSLAAC